MRRWIAVAGLVAGCHAPYRADATMVGDGSYMIRSAPDGEQRSEALAMQAAQRRAREVCPDGYEVLDSKTGIAQSTERVAVFGRRVNETPEVTITVRCTATR